MRKNTYRLTKDVVPIEYKIVLKPDLDRFVFEGEESIEIKVKKETREIILHSKKLKISEVVFERSGLLEKAQISLC